MCQHGLGSILNSAKAKCRAVAGINACDKYLANPCALSIMEMGLPKQFRFGSKLVCFSSAKLPTHAEVNRNCGKSGSGS